MEQTGRTADGWRALDLGFAAILLVATATLFYWRLGYPSKLVFDEVFYVPNGHEIFTLHASPLKTHPFFAQWLIGLSTSIGGDTAFSWRALGAGLGVSTVVSIYFIMRMLGLSAWTALFGAGLTTINQTLMILSRVAMLDVYSLGFFALSVVALMWSARPSRSKRGATLWLVVSGILLGMAVGSKWSAIFYISLIWLGLAAVRLRGAPGEKLSLDRMFQSGRPGWGDRSLFAAALLQISVGVAVYAATFWPLFFFAEGARSPLDLIAYQFETLHEILSAPGGHQDQSPFWKWPLMMETVGFYFGPSSRGGYESIFYVGNPVIFWGGAYLAPICLAFGAMRRDAALLALSGAYFAFWLVWSISARSMTFFYYYEPAADLLGPIIAVFTARIVSPGLRRVFGGAVALAALALFVFFYPSITARHMDHDAWTQYRWFQSWL